MPRSLLRSERSIKHRLLFGSLSLALVALSLAGAASTSSAGSAPTAAPSAVVPCPPDNARVRAGGDGADPNTVTRPEAAEMESVLAAKTNARRLSARSQSSFPGVTVDVRVHVITRNNGSGGVSLGQIQRQVRVLNRAFAGRTAGASASTIFRFQVKSIDYTRNSDWYNWADPDVDPADNREAKRALHRGGWDDLNIYIAGLEDGLLGYATFPSDTSLRRDGVVLLNESLPGGTAAPYNEGDTATHEVGHWLGLYHTFQDGCVTPGDYVLDTPYQDDGDNIFSCEESLDTCPQPGRDPVHNFMSYGDDPCLDRFSAGQARRMTLVWFAFRGNQSLLP